MLLLIFLLYLWNDLDLGGPPTHPHTVLVKMIEIPLGIICDLFFQDKHEENHQPKLHGGLVIKHNANQRYATNAVTAFIFREIAERHQLPIQVSWCKYT